MMYMPIEVPKSSKLHKRPVRSPLLEGSAAIDDRRVINRTESKVRQLTFKEWCVFVGVDVDLLELADSDLLGEGELEPGLRVVPVTVGAHGVGFELFLAERNAERN